VTVNPLVAGRLDGPTDAWSGVWIAEDIELLAQGVKNGSWIDGSLGVAGRFGRTRPDGSVELCRTAFQSEEDLARTLEHEKFHSGELASGKPYPKDMNEAELWEDRAYAHEDDWWKNHSVRPEGAG
jgi:hypothetical protein